MDGVRFMKRKTAKIKQTQYKDKTLNTLNIKDRWESELNVIIQDTTC